MKRRTYLRIAGLVMTSGIGGCSGPGGERGNTAEKTVRITSRAPQPAIPAEYEVSVGESSSTEEGPARLRVRIRNPTEETMVFGEERDVKFHHVTSTDENLYLYPANEDNRGPVEPGCWRLNEHIAVAEYYGTITLNPGDGIQADSFVYGHPDLPTGACLPEGVHEFETSGVVADGEEQSQDQSEQTEFEWGFEIRIESSA